MKYYHIIVLLGYIQFCQFSKGTYCAFKYTKSWTRKKIFPSEQRHYPYTIYSSETIIAKPSRNLFYLFQKDGMKSTRTV